MTRVRLIVSNSTFGPICGTQKCSHNVQSKRLGFVTCVIDMTCSVATKHNDCLRQHNQKLQGRRGAHVAAVEFEALYRIQLLGFSVASSKPVFTILIEAGPKCFRSSVGSEPKCASRSRAMVALELRWTKDCHVSAKALFHFLRLKLS
ncbi:hypothetical protein VFPPC_18764 [Pochonia chlamydosporia 170]|uniref:Uncharacterized protein n=1 Tax=Pochonia chlamydosporia 170 TaxID=1380566 RepID=A0A219ASD8_METCM|nr:hypothetical protein VFPPC_18764 [Pochonia chlamydosporia 170]OWT43509.1 hypothetical protein VFPPC_18764 [Pochonia chlamydosporia 170]